MFHNKKKNMKSRPVPFLLSFVCLFCCVYSILLFWGHWQHDKCLVFLLGSLRWLCCVWGQQWPGPWAQQARILFTSMSSGEMYEMVSQPVSGLLAFSSRSLRSILIRLDEAVNHRGTFVLERKSKSNLTPSHPPHTHVHTNTSWLIGSEIKLSLCGPPAQWRSRAGTERWFYI